MLAILRIALLRKKSSSSFYNDLVSLKPVFWAEMALIVSTYIAVYIKL